MRHAEIRVSTNARSGANAYKGRMQVPDVMPTSQPTTASRDWLRIVLVQLVGLLTLAFIWLVLQLVIPISHTVILFLLGAALAFVLADPSDFFTRRLGGRRSLGIVIAYLILACVVTGVLLMLAVPLAAQLADLAAGLPAYATQGEAWVKNLDSSLQAHGIQVNLESIAAQASSVVVAGGEALLHDLLEATADMGGVLMNAILVLVVSAYLLSGFPAIRRNVIRAVPRRYRGVHEFARSNAARIMGAYLRGQLIMASVIGVLAAVGTGLLGLPDFVVLGVLAGLFELVPMFGPILSAVPAVIVALFQPWPTVVWVIILFLVIQQFESNWLGPRVTGHAVGLHPLGAMFALMVGFEIAGILGGLFAVPVAGVVWVFTVATYQAVMRAAGEPLGDLELGNGTQPEAPPSG